MRKTIFVYVLAAEKGRGGSRRDEGSWAGSSKVVRAQQLAAIVDRAGAENSDTTPLARSATLKSLCQGILKCIKKKGCDLEDEKEGPKRQKETGKGGARGHRRARALPASTTSSAAVWKEEGALWSVTEPRMDESRREDAQPPPPP